MPCPQSYEILVSDLCTNIKNNDISSSCFGRSAVKKFQFVSDSFYQTLYKKRRNKSQETGILEAKGL